MYPKGVPIRFTKKINVNKQTNYIQTSFSSTDRTRNKGDKLNNKHLNNNKTEQPFL